MLFNIDYTNKVIQIELGNRKETYYFDNKTGIIIEYIINDNPRCYPYMTIFFNTWLNNFETFINKINSYIDEKNRNIS